MIRSLGDPVLLSESVELFGTILLSFFVAASEKERVPSRKFSPFSEGQQTFIRETRVGESKTRRAMDRLWWPEGFRNPL